MKRFELTFAFIQLPFDFLALILAGISAYFLRYADFVTRIRPVLFDLPWQRYWPLVLIASAGWLVIFAFNDLYHTDPNRKLLRDLNRIIFASSTGFAAITIYVFFTLQKFDSRFLVLASWILAMLFVCLERILIRLVKMTFYNWGYGLRRTIIIGSGQVAQIIKENLTTNPRLGYAIVNSYPRFDQTIATNILASKPDEMLYTEPKSSEAETLRTIDFANQHHITFKYSADLFATISSNMTVSTIAGIPIIELRRTRLTGWSTINKRLFDIIGSIFLLIVTSPLLLIITIIILVETGRPVIYKNERVGRKERKFFALKFRSMYQKDCTGAQFGSAGETNALEKEKQLIKTQSIKTGPVYKIKDDPRVTPFGRFIRKWSLDELPQLVNVLFGEMSLVGPRPHQPREVDNYQKEFYALLTIKPGITGMAQISGRSDLNFEDEARLDIFYIEHWSWLLDLVILLKTPLVVFGRKGAW